MAIVGKAGYAVGCMLAALVLVGSGFAYYVKSQVGEIGNSDAITEGPQTGAMNILLMGLESRPITTGTSCPATSSPPCTRAACRASRTASAARPRTL
jgi:hypothetical protein